MSYPVPLYRIRYHIQYRIRYCDDVGDMAANPETCDDNLKDVQFVPRGFLKLLIARLLAKRELTGTQIMGILEDRSKGKWRPSPGSIYPLLSSLEELELIMTVRTEGRSKIYTLSPKGHLFFDTDFTDFTDWIF